MSQQAIRHVWKLTMDPVEKFVLLAYLHHANEDGSGMQPGMETIAEETGYSVRWAQKVTRKLEAQSYLIPVKNQSGGRGHVAEYRFPMERVGMGKDELQFTVSLKDELEDTLYMEKGESEDTLSGVKGESEDTLSGVKGELKGELKGEHDALPQVSQVPMVSPAPLPSPPSLPPSTQKIPPSPPKGGSSPRGRSPAPTDEDVAEVLTHLNAVAHKRQTDGQFIAACLKHGNTVDDCKLVIDWFGAVKCVEWADGPRFFNAKTPFRPANFPGYLDEARQWDEQGRASPGGSRELNPRSRALKVGVQQGTEQILARFDAMESSYESRGCSPVYPRIGKAR